MQKRKEKREANTEDKMRNGSGADLRFSLGLKYKNSVSEKFFIGQNLKIRANL